MKIYGIRNCDTMKKAMTWLEEHGIGYEFIDYKKTGVATDRLPHWIKAAGWETLLNRRGLMWKKLTDEDRTDVDAAKAARLMTATPSLIKRPVIEHGNSVIVGFDPEHYAQRFGK